MTGKPQFDESTVIAAAVQVFGAMATRRLR